MTPSTTSPEILEHIEELASRGIKLNKTQVWILIVAFEKPRTIRQLADLKNLSYQAMYNHTKHLEALGLIDPAFQVGKEQYWRCRIDISDAADFTLKLRYKKQDLNFEHLLGYFQSTDDAGSYKRVFRLALAYLYDKSERHSRNEHPKGPTGTEIRSMLIRTVQDMNDIVMLMNRVIELPIFELSDKLQDQFGDKFEFDTTKELIQWTASNLRAHWGTAFSVKGLNNPNTPKDYAREELQTWHVPENVPE